MKFLSTICIVWMVFASCVSAFGQGVAIRSLNGLGTNLNVKAAAGSSLALTVNTNNLVVTNGSVGIGTDSPMATWKVNVFDATDTRVLIETTRVAGEALGSYKNGTAQYTLGVEGTTGAFRLGEGTTLSANTRLSILTTSGNVGIGTPTPANRLDVEGAVAVGAGFSGSSTAPANGLIVEGMVGIGTAAPGAQLQVARDGMQYNSEGTAGISMINFSNTAKALTMGYDGSMNLGYIQAVHSGVETRPLLLNATGGNVGIGTAAPRDKLEVAGGIIISNTGSGLKIGPGNATLTNTLYASATLDFPSTVAGTVSDLLITVAGAADGDIIALGEPSGSIGPLTGVYNAWASNGVVYVRFANNNLVTAQDPASGLFKVRVDKFQ